MLAIISIQVLNIYYLFLLLLRSYTRSTAGIHCIGGWVGPRTGLERCRKSRPPPRFDPRTVLPVASRYTDYAIPDHICHEEWIKTLVGLLGPEEETTTLIPKRRRLLTKLQVVISQRRESSSTYCREHIKGRHKMAHPSMEGIMTSKLIVTARSVAFRLRARWSGGSIPFGTPTSLTLIFVINQLNAQILVF